MKVLNNNVKFVKIRTGQIGTVLNDDYGFVTILLDTLNKNAITLQGLTLSPKVQSKYDIIKQYSRDDYPEMYLGVSIWKL